MGIRSSLVKALARTEVPYEIGNGNGVMEVKSIPTIPVPFWTGAQWTSPLGVRDYVLSDPVITRWTAYAASALAYICMSYRAEKLSEPPLSVVDVTDDGEEWLDEHELAGLLARPNADYTMSRLLHITSLYQDITGSALWLKIRDRGKQTRRMYAYSGDEFTVESTDDRLFGKFRIRIKGDELEVGPEDVVFFPGIDPANPLGAVSPLDVALTMLGLGTTLTGSARTALANAVRPGGALSVPETLNDAEFDMMLGQLLQQHGGAVNAGKPLLLTGGATWETIQWSLQEMMPAEVISWVEATVCAVFKVHPMVLGLKSGIDASSGLSGARDKTAERMFYDNFAIPRWTANAELMTDQLLRDIDFDEAHFVRYFTANIAALQDDLVEKSTILTAVQHCTTINEQRQWMGYDPLPTSNPVGEMIFVPATWVPAEMLVNPPEPKPIAEPFGGGADEEDGEPDAAPDDDAPEEE